MIDGLRARDGLLKPGEGSSIQLSTAVYLGSPPPHLHDDLKVTEYTLFIGNKRVKLNTCIDEEGNNITLHICNL